MTISQLENFIAVAEAGSFSSAAEKRYISPQALIQQIAKMETELGFKLFVRSSKGVKLSPGGEEYARSVKKVLAEYARGIERAAKKAESANTLRIGLPECVAPAYLLAVCHAFAKRYPSITLRYDTYSRSETVKALLAGKIDLAAQIRPEIETPYFSENMFPAAHYCLLRSDDPLSIQPAISLHDLDNRTLGCFGSTHAYRILEEQIHLLGLNIQLRSIPEDFSDALVFCMDGNVLLASVPMISYLRNSLKVVPFRFNLGFSYYLSYTQEDSEPIQRFLEVAREIAMSEEHPWKQTTANFPIDK